MNFSVLKRNGLPDLAYRKTEGNSPCVIFLGGFRSDMSGTKATFLEDFCRAGKQGFIRFDYSGHGESGGAFHEGTIGKWLSDSLDVIDKLSNGPLILAGSSMGGWLAMLAAMERPDRVKGFIGLAAAPDFTVEIYNENAGACNRQFDEKGYFELPNEFSDEPYIITEDLIEDGKKHLIMGKGAFIDMPAYLIQGKLDDQVPWTTATQINENIFREKADLVLIDDADHRLSRPGDLEILAAGIEKISGLINRK